MLQAFPAIHGFPMSGRPLLHTRDLALAVPFIHDLVEPFQFLPDRAAGADIRITGMFLEKMKLFGVNHGTPVLVRSTPLQSYYFVIPLRGTVVGTVNATELRAVPGEALVYAADHCLHAHWSADCMAMVLALPRAELELAARRYAPAAPPAPPLMPKLVLSQGPGRSFANLLACLSAECDGRRDGDGTATVREGLQDLLLASLVQMNAHLWPAGLERVSTRRRRAGVARALDYIHMNAHRTITTAELARAACLSLRALQTGFAECFGVGPMSYAKRYRLERARDELTAADHRDVAVSDLAMRWGFASAGTFTRLYRQQFGELPSQTLKQVPQRSAPARVRWN